MFPFGDFSWVTTDHLVVYFTLGCIVGGLFKVLFEFATLYKNKELVILRALLWPFYFLVIFAREEQVRILKHVTWSWLPHLPVSRYSYTEYMLTMGVLWLPKLYMIALGWVFAILWVILVFVLVAIEAFSDDM